MTTPKKPHGWTRRLVDAFRVEWREVGLLGRVALLGIGVSLLVAVALGFWIPGIVSRHLLVARADLMATIGTEIAAKGLVPVGPPGSDSYRAFDEEMRLRAVGGETVRVKLWSLDGVVLYSDDPSLVGRRFGLSEPARAALEGRTSFNISDLTEPAHARDKEFGELLEFYVPVRTPEGELFGLFEVEQRADELRNTVGHIQRNVWMAIVSGLGTLGVFMGALAVASARIMNRRRRDAERLLGTLFKAQEEERKRTVAALHDDIGQPLYRLLYGLEGAKARLGGDHPVSAELERLEDLVRDMDRTLRAELRLLHRGVQEDLDLRSAIKDLVESTRQETALRIELDTGGVDDTVISDVARVALLHAVREALINVRKHAEATRVWVTVRNQPDRVVLEVRDDGKGIGRQEGLGLVTIRERLQAIGGGLTVAGRRGAGTRFRAWVPVEERGEL